MTMKRAIMLLSVFLFATMATFAQAAEGDKILGIWLSENKNGKIQIYKAGNKYFGKLIWGRTMYEADGVTSKKDTKNSDESMRNRNLKDMVILTNMEYDDGEWTDGKVYDPEKGKTYSCTMKLNGNQLNLRGYVGVSLLGRTSVWTRVQ